MLWRAPRPPTGPITTRRGIHGRTRSLTRHKPAAAEADPDQGTSDGPPASGAARVIAVRCLRSFTQGFLNIVTPLYLLTHGVSSTGIGVLYSASFLVGAALTAPIGVLADRYGRKPFLVTFTVLMALWGALYATTTVIPVLLVASAIAGIGRGGAGVGGGQAGPFAPAEQALLADLVLGPARRRMFRRRDFRTDSTGSHPAALPSSREGTRKAHGARRG